jgi:hypothetical protein
MSEEDGMIATTDSHTAPLRKPRHRRASCAAIAATCWIVAALLVAIANSQLAASPVAAVIIEVLAILILAGTYMRIAVPEATLDHALFVGTAWVLLAIATELIMTARSGRQWFALLGSPGHGGLRCVLLIAWLIAPAVFVRSQE